MSQGLYLRFVRIRLWHARCTRRTRRVCGAPCCSMSCMARPCWIGALLLTPALLPAPQVRNSTLAASARAVLERGAADADPDVRRETAVALSLTSRRDPSATLLEKLAADKDHLVREAALVSIGELKDPALAKFAHDALDDDVPEVAFAAARTLFKLNQPEGKQLLLEIVEDEVPAKSRSEERRV